MKYEFDLTIGAKISAEVVEKMVTHIAEQQIGKKVAGVKSLYKDGVFTGYDVVFTDEQIDKSTLGFKREF